MTVLIELKRLYYLTECTVTQAIIERQFNLIRWGLLANGNLNQSEVETLQDLSLYKAA